MNRENCWTCVFYRAVSCQLSAGTVVCMQTDLRDRRANTSSSDILNMGSLFSPSLLLNILKDPSS